MYGRYPTALTVDRLEHAVAPPTLRAMLSRESISAAPRTLVMWCVQARASMCERAPPLPAASTCAQHERLHSLSERLSSLSERLPSLSDLSERLPSPSERVCCVQWVAPEPARVLSAAEQRRWLACVAGSLDMLVRTLAHAFATEAWVVRR